MLGASAACRKPSCAVTRGGIGMLIWGGVPACNYQRKSPPEREGRNPFEHANERFMIELHVLYMYIYISKASKQHAYQFIPNQKTHDKNKRDQPGLVKECRSLFRPLSRLLAKPPVWGLIWV